MTSEVMNHLWQSTLFAVAAGLVALAFRRNRAQVRYWLWFSASVKFLVSFALLVSLGSLIQWQAPAAASPAPAFPAAIVQIAQPFAGPVSIAVPAPESTNWIPVLIGIVWACGFLAIAGMRVREWLRVRAILRASTPVELPIALPAFAAPGALEPGVVGFLRPVVLIPEGMLERLTPSQLKAILAHELCHARRRDNLTAAIHMMVEAIFWFHPLVWWIGARLVEERERACDETVLSQGSEPRDYAEGILSVCKLSTESPLTCVSGITGSDLKKRIEAIMTNRITVRLNFAKKTALALAGAAALTVPVVVGTMNAPAAIAQSTSAAIPKWEVVSIRPCASESAPRGRGSRGGGGPASRNDPGRLRLECQPVDQLIRLAYIRFASGKPRPEGIFPVSIRVMNQTIQGSPAWIKSDRFTIEAKPESAQPVEMMRGPMLQTLLEDRFKLRIHRQLREVPVYALVVAKGGPKLAAAKTGSCGPLPDPTKGPPVIRPDQPPPCGTFRPDQNGGTETMGQTLEGLSMQLSVALDRDVVDRTGIAGAFDMDLDLSLHDLFPFMPTDNALAGADTAAPQASSDPLGTVTAAMQRLGLKLESAKEPTEFLVIDHLERPSEN